MSRSLLVLRWLIEPNSTKHAIFGVVTTCPSETYCIPSHPQIYYNVKARLVTMEVIYGWT